MHIADRVPRNLKGVCHGSHPEVPCVQNTPCRLPTVVASPPLEPVFWISQAVPKLDRLLSASGCEVVLPINFLGSYVRVALLRPTDNHRLFLS